MTLKSHGLPLPAMLIICCAATTALAQKPTSSPARAPSPPVVSTMPRVKTLPSWSGDLRPMHGTTAGASSTQVTYSGRVSIQDLGGFYRVTLRVRSAGGDETLPWGISRGRCGATLMLLTPADTPPQLEVYQGVDGVKGPAGNLIYEGPLALTDFDAFHLAVFRNGMDAKHMVACANLKFSPSSS